MDNVIVKCLTLDAALSGMSGDTVHIPLQTARMLQGMGKVKITDDKVPAIVNLDTNYISRRAFSPRNLTKVAWVQNYDKNGGAEISNFTCINKGIDFGFDIVGVVINNGFDTKIIDKADIVVVNNLHNENKNRYINYLTQSSIPYVVYSHDCFEENQTLFKKAMLNVFISPLHKQHYVDLCQSEIESKSITLPLAIDPEKWNHNTNGRIKNSVFIPCYKKCSNEVMKFVKINKQYQYTTIGGPYDGIDSDTIPKQDYMDMCKLYPRFEIVLHTPNAKTAGERILFEAVLSGCKVITNKNAGHSSWEFDWWNESTLRQVLPKAITDFWKAIDKVVNK